VGYDPSYFLSAETLALPAIENALWHSWSNILTLASFALCEIKKGRYAERRQRVMWDPKKMELDQEPSIDAAIISYLCFPLGWPLVTL